MCTIIKIDSALRTAASTGPQDFYVNLPFSISGAWRLRSVWFSTSAYNVNATNNKIYFFENATAKTATLTNGFYDTISLPTQVASALTTTSSGFATYTCSI